MKNYGRLAQVQVECVRTMEILGKISYPVTLSDCVRIIMKILRVQETEDLKNIFYLC